MQGVAEEKGDGVGEDGGDGGVEEGWRQEGDGDKVRGEGVEG